MFINAIFKGRYTGYYIPEREYTINLIVLEYITVTPEIISNGTVVPDCLIYNSMDKFLSEWELD